MARVEKLMQLPLDKRRGAMMEIQILQVTADAGASIVAALSVQNDPDQVGIVIGKGATRSAALSDAQSTLQSALDAVDVAILKLARS